MRFLACDQLIHDLFQTVVPKTCLNDDDKKCSETQKCVPGEDGRNATCGKLFFSTITTSDTCDIRGQDAHRAKHDITR